MRSAKEVFGLGYVIGRTEKIMRDEMSTVLWKIESSREVSPEALVRSPWLEQWRK